MQLKRLLNATGYLDCLVKCAGPSKWFTHIMMTTQDHWMFGGFVLPTIENTIAHSTGHHKE